MSISHPYPVMLTTLPTTWSSTLGRYEPESGMTFTSLLIISARPIRRAMRSFPLRSTKLPGL